MKTRKAKIMALMAAATLVFFQQEALWRRETEIFIRSR